MIKAKVSANYKDIERIFAGGSIQKEILKVWSTEADEYVFEAWRVLEMEGPLPLSIRANGEPIIDYRIYGNAEQTGTPTPENPADIVGCGERTDNLFDKDAVVMGGLSADGSIGINTSIYVSDYIRVNPNMVYTATYLIIAYWGRTVAYYDKNKSFISIGNNITQSEDGTSIYTMTTPDNCYYIRVATTIRFINHIDEIMFNAGSTPLPYEPYGYKLPILSNSSVTNIYLGEAQTTRRIKKLVLTGEENTWERSRTASNTFYFNVSGYLRQRINITICSHYTSQANINGAAEMQDGNVSFYANVGQPHEYFYVRDSNFATVADFKSYLDTQYAAGTPITVWYVLAEPETGIVNEPLMKIGDYADTVDSAQANTQIPTSKGTTILDYDGEDHLITSDGYELVDKNQNGFILSGSTLRPSKMYIKYKGR